MEEDKTHRRRCGQSSHTPKHGELWGKIAKKKSDLQTNKSNRLVRILKNNRDHTKDDDPESPQRNPRSII